MACRTSGFRVIVEPVLRPIFPPQASHTMRKYCAFFQDVALDSARNYFYDQAFYATTTDPPLS